MLSRAAAADMYPSERRARGIAFVLFGLSSARSWARWSSLRSSPAKGLTRATL
jgi:hypothetical protein